jgi:beta-N-acetylglucosaminidase
MPDTSKEFQYIDLEIFQNMQGEHSQNLHSLMEKAESMLRNKGEQLYNGLDQQNAGAIYIAAHQIKSTMAYIGSEEINAGLHELMRKMERQEEWDEIVSQGQKVLKLLEGVLEEVQTFQGEV